jgi:hypothetical protein
MCIPEDANSRLIGLSGDLLNVQTNVIFKRCEEESDGVTCATDEERKAYFGKALMVAPSITSYINAKAKDDPIQTVLDGDMRVNVTSDVPLGFQINLQVQRLSTCDDWLAFGCWSQSDQTFLKYNNYETKSTLSSGGDVVITFTRMLFEQVTEREAFNLMDFLADLGGL